MSFQVGFSLVNDSGTSQGDDHTSITRPFQYSESIFSSQQPSHSILLSCRQSCISSLSYQSSSSLNRVSYHSWQSSPVVWAEVPPTSRSEHEAYREAFEAANHLPAEQACLSVPIFSDKTPELQKKAAPLAHLSYVFTSCSHSSFSGNQNGPTLYSCCCELESINVYTSHTFEPSHSMDSPRIPWADWLRALNALLCLLPHCPCLLPLHLSRPYQTDSFSTRQLVFYVQPCPG